jgi:hypothetical protein
MFFGFGLINKYFSRAFFFEILISINMSLFHLFDKPKPSIMPEKELIICRISEVSLGNFVLKVYALYLSVLIKNLNYLP